LRMEKIASARTVIGFFSVAVHFRPGIGGHTFFDKTLFRNANGVMPVTLLNNLVK
jgi:hypothetical protein